MMTSTSLFHRITAGTVAQMAYVTDDLEHAMAQYDALLGGPKWTVAHIDGFADLTYRGRDASFTFEQALAQFGGMQLEIISPNGGENIYTEALIGAAPRALIAHHMGFDLYDVDDYRAARDTLVAEGFPVVQGGRHGDTEFSYFDTRPAIGVFVELLWLDPPARAGFAEVARTSRA